ncbi:putative DNA-binding protein [Cytobacillus oceanisediminis]|uniref:Putative DNA-binding protein n=1 Tax=Cytobacillus oceanisediminis TaxID=665099 RepID=A0A2V2ZRI5_9BACI|nr:RNA-binding domain-containing protein [Cytobacillus oceanisediminis]PWW26607.1 putative DNA-binding protein [Cytobacillus oceanisediminis]
MVSTIIKEEGLDVEYKLHIKGLDSEDLVAFANSEQGGVIYIGVQEERDIDGKQKGKVVGHKISDGFKLTILDKAQSCIPPVNITVETLEMDGKDIYKINIPSGIYKPYCTKSGTYKVRGDGQNHALTPNQLLSMFMENEREKFIERFKEATTELEDVMSHLKVEVTKQTSIIVEDIKEMGVELKHQMELVGDTADNVEMNASSIESTVEEIDSTTTDIWHYLKRSLFQIPKLDSKINDLMDKFEVSDTFEVQQYVLIREVINNFITPSNAKRYSDARYAKKQVDLLKDIFPSFHRDEIKKIFMEVVTEKTRSNF